MWWCIDLCIFDCVDSFFFIHFFILGWWCRETFSNIEVWLFGCGILIPRSDLVTQARMTRSFFFLFGSRKKSLLLLILSFLADSPWTFLSRPSTTRLVSRPYAMDEHRKSWGKWANNPIFYLCLTKFERQTRGIGNAKKKWELHKAGRKKTTKHTIDVAMASRCQEFLEAMAEEREK